MPALEGAGLRPTALAPGRVRLSAVIAALYPVFLLGTALDAYDIGGIPIVWLVRIGAIGAFVAVGFVRPLYRVPGTTPLLGMFVWGVVVTAINVVRLDHAEIQPALATTGYYLFVGLRLLTVLAFLATTYLVYWLLRSGHHQALRKWTVIMGTIVAVGAFYIYFAQLNNLPEPPRTRIGTGGAEQATRFTYAFHRAMGSFREPAYLAEWLVLPLMLSLSYPGARPVNVHSLTIGGALLLTGSLTGIVGSAGGFLGALVLTRGSLRGRFRSFLRFVVMVALAGLIFLLVARAYQGPRPSLAQVVIERLSPMLQGGLVESNRGYIYEYVQTTPVPLVGAGYGNANLLLSSTLGSQTTASFLSLYLYTLYSAGIIGLLLLFLYLLTPIVALVRRRVADTQKMVLTVSAYLAWLIMFAVSSEELQLMFAVTYGLVVFELFGSARPRQP